MNGESNAPQVSSFYEHTAKPVSLCLNRANQPLAAPPGLNIELQYFEVQYTLMSIRFALDVTGAVSIPGSAVASFRNNACHWKSGNPSRFGKRYKTATYSTHMGGGGIVRKRLPLSEEIYASGPSNRLRCPGATLNVQSVAGGKRRKQLKPPSLPSTNRVCIAGSRHQNTISPSLPPPPPPRLP